MCPFRANAKPQAANQAASLRQHLADDLAVHVRQAEVAAAEAVREAQMIQAHKVQQRRMQIVNRDAILDGAMSDLVGGTVARAPSDAATGEPDGESMRVVIAARAA